MLGLNGSISPCHIIQLDLDPLGFEMAFNWAYTYQLFVVENWTNEALEYKKTYTRQIYLLILFLTDMRSQVAVWSNNAPSTSPTCLTLSFGLAHFIGHTTLCYCCPLTHYTMLLLPAQNVRGVLLRKGQWMCSYDRHVVCMYVRACDMCDVCVGL